MPRWWSLLPVVAVAMARYDIMDTHGPRKQSNTEAPDFSFAQRMLEEVLSTVVGRWVDG